MLCCADNLSNKLKKIIKMGNELKKIIKMGKELKKVN